jgi:chromosome segregation ATPase
MEEEVNARVESIREECERQVLVANETVALLQKEAERLFMELEDLTTSMAVAENERERVAAEYGYVIKSYVNLKHELEDGKKQIVTLEGQLADTTSKLERYQKETQQWKDECT